MKKLTVLISLVACACFVFAQEKSPDEQMAKIKQLSMPGPGHEILAKFAGEWDITTRWYPDKGQPPVESKASNSTRMIFGGRFLRSDFHGEMMGKPFAGVGLEGFDNFKKKFTMVWLDETSTAMYTAEGTADSSGKVITYFGKRDDPMSGQSGLGIKYVGTWVDDNHHTFAIYEHPGTKDEYKSLEMVYTRK